MIAAGAANAWPGARSATSIAWPLANASSARPSGASASDGTKPYRSVATSCTGPNAPPGGATAASSATSLLPGAVHATSASPSSAMPACTSTL